ncbi:MAG: hypothetical protein JEY96_15370 [Bacteroidales bacterium]|nr:hypothetical protein [Bacteroidales bacterium]
MNFQEIIQWLLQGDISIQYQTYRDLLGNENNDLRARIEIEGWGKQFLSKRNENGHWGLRFYQPKWTSTHYTLIDLKNLSISKNCKPILETIDIILSENKSPDGGILPVGEMQRSDMCINGMCLNYFSYFNTNQNHLKSIIDIIIDQQLKDGGFNCRLNRSGAKHSSLHTTISVLEGVLEYKTNKYTYRLNELVKVEKEAQEFILQHRLFKSDKTGEIIDKRFTRLPYPSRWRYDILRVLDYFQKANVNYDDRMQDAVDVLISKRTKEGFWKLNANYPGQVHFNMEKAGGASRWNTLRAVRVLNHFQGKN